MACKDYHDVPGGPANWMRLTTTEEGRFPDLFVAFLVAPCYHCQDPLCADACPAGAVQKMDSDGLVLVNADLCLGKEECGRCSAACPYNAPQFGPEPDARMQKCTLCADRLTIGQLPICVEACPVHALDAGPLDGLRVMYGGGLAAAGFRYDLVAAPSVLFKPKLRR